MFRSSSDIVLLTSFACNFIVFSQYYYLVWIEFNFPSTPRRPHQNVFTIYCCNSSCPNSSMFKSSNVFSQNVNSITYVHFDLSSIHVESWLTLVSYIENSVTTFSISYPASTKSARIFAALLLKSSYTPSYTLYVTI